jgi:beta-1,4-mannosyl-glycoprotein beta-1,4-N-acetylglucosaminyltransferase
MSVATKKIRVVDCFTFYNELEMLKFRLNELSDYVDYFVIVESTKTHSGNLKPLYFKENKILFESFLNKIIHVIVDNFPETQDPWVRENFQRDSISLGLSKIKLDPWDLVFVSDCDEVWNPEILNDIPNSPHIFSLEQDLYFYNLESKYTASKWYHSKVCRYSIYCDSGGAQKIRMSHCDPELNPKLRKIGKAGWHFSYFGNSEFIRNKILNFAHQEYNNKYFTDISRIEEKMNNGEYLFGGENSIDSKLQNLPIESNPDLPKNSHLLDIR